MSAFSKLIDEREGKALNKPLPEMALIENYGMKQHELPTSITIWFLLRAYIVSTA